MMQLFVTSFVEMLKSCWHNNKTRKNDLKKAYPQYNCGESRLMN